jgi:hypothetical protein
VVDLADVIEDKEVVALTLGPREEAIVLAATSADASIALGRHGEPGGPSVPDSSAQRAYEASLVVVRGDDVSGRDLTALTAAFPVVQPLPEGETLIVGARAYQSEPNAAVYDSDGVLVREFLLGEGSKTSRRAKRGRFGSPTSTRACTATPDGESRVVRRHRRVASRDSIV